MREDNTLSQWFPYRQRNCDYSGLFVGSQFEKIKGLREAQHEAHPRPPSTAFPTHHPTTNTTVADSVWLPPNVSTNFDHVRTICPTTLFGSTCGATPAVAPGTPGAPRLVVLGRATARDCVASAARCRGAVAVARDFSMQRTRSCIEVVAPFTTE